MPKTTIQCENVWKIFGKFPRNIWEILENSHGKEKEILLQYGCTLGIQDISFSIQEGEIFAIMGLSGSGKSTLLRCINRLAEITIGKIFIENQEISSMTPKAIKDLRQKKISMVFQHFALLPHRTVLENAAFGLEIQKVDKNKRHEMAREMLDMVGLKDCEQSYPEELSGGMQQRVGLARALLSHSDIILMDEPFSALDPIIREQMCDEFLKIVAHLKKTIVFITHDMGEALKVADRIAVMKDGKILQIATPEEIILHPNDIFIEKFVQSAFSVLKILPASMQRLFADSAKKSLSEK
ncbi:MAG: betaine/proline/choline family ABC transporter ATP-binding protein [Candidatus Brocadiae bacterium]|nr:betaine/proline/choline family ABC transporter ATP-binding protein [Candidatus Brocadiia bacterium]